MTNLETPTPLPTTIQTQPPIPVVPPPAVVTSPDEFIHKWSWGGFFLTWIYFLASRTYKKGLLYFLGMFLPIFNIYLWIRSGLRGRKLVWESWKWADFEEYKKRQRLLDKIGLVLFGLCVVFLGVIFAMAMIGSPPDKAKKTETKNSAADIFYATPVSETGTKQRAWEVYTSGQEGQMPLSDFINAAEDEKQFIMFTKPIVIQDDGVSLYQVTYLYFEKTSAGEIKFLGIRNPRANSMDALKDADQDGLTDNEEIETDSKLQDTDGDGWWDGTAHVWENL